MASLAGRESLFVVIVLACQFFVSSAQLTEEDKLRAAILNSAVSSYELKTDIKLTKNLPFFAIPPGAIRKFNLFSKSRVTIFGAKKYVGFRTPAPDGSFTDSLIDFAINNVNLVNFKATGITSPAEKALDSTYPDFGAAVRISGSLKIYNSLISNNIARGDGGAVYVSKGLLELTNCQFSGNQGGRQGGAVAHIGDKGGLTVSSCTFTNNKVKPKSVLARGGAIFFEALSTVGINAVIRTTVFKGNIAASGGAFYTFFSQDTTAPLLFDTCTFDSNSVTNKIEAMGGAILANYVTNLRFIRPTFKNNLMNAKRNDVFVFWNLPGNTTISGVLNSGVVIASNEPGRYTINS